MSLPPATTEQLLQRHGPLVMKIIWNLIPRSDDARDIFQETFLQHFQARKEGRTIRHPKAWLCRTARNRAFQFLRQRLRKGSGSGADELEKIPAPTIDPDRILLLAKVRNLAATLPERQAQVFILRHFEHETFAEISTHLGCSEEAARASCYKALKKIRSILGEPSEDTHV